MEGTSANTPEPVPQNSPSEQKEEDKETFEIKAGPLQLKGTEHFILTLILGVLGGVVSLYLILFQLKKPEFLYVWLVQTPISQTLTAQPTASPLPAQTVVVTKEVTQFVTTERVIKETVIVTTEVVITKLQEVIITEIVTRPIVITATPSPTATPKTEEEILTDGVAKALECGADALDYLGGKTIPGLDDNTKVRIINYWWRNEFKCLQIWVDAYARDKFIEDLVKLLNHYENIERAKWKVDSYQLSQMKNPYILQPFTTTLTIMGDYQCPPPTSTPQLTNTLQITSTPQIVDTNSDDPFTYTIQKMTVEVQQENNRVVIRTWKPESEDYALKLLREKCP